MRVGTFWGRLVLFACAPSLAVMSVSGHSFCPSNPHAEFQEKKPADVKTEVSEAEANAAQKIQSAPDPAGKLKSSAEFLKQYPKSTLRPRVATYLAGSITGVTDTAQQITLAEGFLSLFNEAGEVELVYPVLLNAYLKSERVDDAFRIAASMLEKNPDDFEVLTQMAIIGTQQAQRQNTKYIQQSQQYGTRAISLMDADKKPVAVSDAYWKEYKARWMPDLYLSMAVLSLAKGDAVDAQNKLRKAVSLDPANPFGYALLGNIANNEYQEKAKQYNATPPGPARDKLMKDSQAQLEQVVTLYAQSVALSEGNAKYQQLHDQVMQDLQSYYKFLHNGSTDGLQAVIEQYKKPVTSP
jgi:tetratricopeptide (TPR) repeat protein